MQTEEESMNQKNICKQRNKREGGDVREENERQTKSQTTQTRSSEVNPTETQPQQFHTKILRKVWISSYPKRIRTLSYTYIKYKRTHRNNVQPRRHRYENIIKYYHNHGRQQQGTDSQRKGNSKKRYQTTNAIPTR